MQAQQNESWKNVSLPKWPQMLVAGKPVTVEQAQDIILRTDDFLTDVSDYRGGNNHRWNAWAADVLGYAGLKEKLGQNLWEFQSRLREALGHVSTEYVSNSWASCAFIYGPHGWCHPDGTIAHVDNVGKWPSAEEVHADWVRLAQAFPWLDLAATLMSEESSGGPDGEVGAPVVTFIVKDGGVTVAQQPVEVEVAMPKRNLDAALARLHHGGREQGLPDDWMEAYAERTRPIVAKLLSELAPSS